MKIDYGMISWDAVTNWEFCGTKENLRTVWERYFEYFGVRVPIEEFAYWPPRRALAFARGDVVMYRATGEAARYAVVSRPCGEFGTLHVRIADGTEFKICSNEIPGKISIADIPDELVELARAEADKPVDFSKCPLRKPACVGD